ncbi:MAG TPA: response regulator [Methylomirabilota bacterium]
MMRAKILVVDDTPQNLVAIEAILDDPALEVVCARSAREALRRLLAEEFAAILLDVYMPDMDGFEAAALIRQRPLSAHTPILFLTAYASDAQQSRAYALGAVDFIQTPVEPVVLRAKVAVFADLYRNRAEVKSQAERLRFAEEQLRRQAETALRESEGRFRVLCTSAPVAIFQLDSDGHCVYVSPLWEQTTGQPAADALDDGWAEALSPGRGSELLASWRGTVAAERFWQHAQHVTDARGHGRWLLGKSSPIQSEAGDTLGHVGTVEDVTQQKAVEEELREADRRKDEFLAMLAHELRNPLAAIGNAVRVASTPGLHARREWSLQVVARQVGQLSKLIDDLMDASRVRLGKIALRSDRLDLLQVLGRAIDAVLPETGIRGQRVEVSCDEGPLWVLGDATRLEQVFVNLLSNASKYSPRDGRIQVTAGRSSDRTAVRVRDHGVGLEPAMLSRIFDLFVQGETSLDRTQGGLGIGLSLARRLTELHGGTISAHSDGAGRGSEFVVTLPLAPALSEHRPEARSGVSAGPSPGGTILLVDDNEDAAEALAVLLQAEGFDVFTAHDGHAALELAAKIRPYAVLTDLGLPVVDGYQLARGVRNRPGGSDVLLVALSGYGAEQDRQRSASAGFDHHLVKPVDCTQLVELLHSAARTRETPGGAAC